MPYNYTYPGYSTPASSSGVYIPSTGEMPSRPAVVDEKGAVDNEKAAAIVFNDPAVVSAGVAAPSLVRAVTKGLPISTVKITVSDVVILTVCGVAAYSITRKILRRKR